MRESPRIRRLRTDLKSLEQLRAESAIFDFVPHGDPPEMYLLRFRGRGFWRPQGSAQPVILESHEVRVDLGASYPRMMPGLTWKSPIFHPNISAGGVVCLGGYGTYWVPSLNLDELCQMLWDMIRYKNFDVQSPYNREAAAWARSQRVYPLPIDPRPIRDRLAAGLVRRDGAPKNAEFPSVAAPPVAAGPPRSPAAALEPVEAEILFLDDSPVVDAQIIDPDEPDVMIIE
jgi:ubiquitin-protein ligase